MSLLDLWWTGVRAVTGQSAVQRALAAHPISAPDHIISVGKAAASMARAADEAFPQTPMLIVTKDGHSAEAPAHARVIEASHPVPDQRSLAAGAALIETVTQMQAGSHLLMLVSGGASSLAEALPDDMDLDALQAETAAMLASGADIHAMNARRRALSQVKGGKLLARFSGERVTTLAISDVEGDALNVIGSGIGAAPEAPPFSFDAQIVASNAIARTMIAQQAQALVIQNEEILYADVTALAPQIAGRVKDGPKGLYIFGGEPTVVLPENPGKGGRNMALALTLAREIAGCAGIRILVAGTDGTDGPTDAAGALIDGDTWNDTATLALERANAYPWLEAQNALVKTGPTGTNVMDLVLVEKT